MSGGIVIAAFVAGLPAPATPAVGFVHEARVEGVAATLADLAGLGALPAPMRERAGALPIVRRPVGTDRVTVSVSRLAESARRQMPALAPWLPRDASGGSVFIQFVDGVAPPSTEPPRTNCVRVVAPLAAGTIPVGSDLQPSPCDRRIAPAAFRFDRRLGVVVAGEDLTEGEVVQAPPAFALAALRPGQQLYLRTQVGPVMVERAAEVVRPAPSGQAVFVRASGEVFAVPTPENSQ